MQVTCPLSTHDLQRNKPASASGLFSDPPVAIDLIHINLCEWRWIIVVRCPVRRYR